MANQFQMELHLVAKGGMQDLGKLYELIEDLIDEFDVCELVELAGGITPADVDLEHDEHLLEAALAGEGVGHG